MIKRLVLLTFSLVVIVPCNVFADDDYDWIWFFYEKESGLSEYETFRPFYHTVTNSKQKYTTVLPPVVFSSYETKLQYKRNLFFGLCNDVQFFHQNGDRDFDFVFYFPLVFYGEGDDPSDNYLMMWPFGGSIKGKLGLDTINPFIFPGVSLFLISPPTTLFAFAGYTLISWIPLYTYYQDGDYEGYSILWPLFLWGEGKNRESLRIIPFYSHYYKENYYDNISYLMLFNYRETYYKDRTDYTFFFFPFYGRKWSSDKSIYSHTFLWPFFTWGYNLNTNYYGINFIWPIFQYAESTLPDYNKVVVMPFYGHFYYTNSKTFFITPFYFKSYEKYDKFELENRYYFIVAWYYHRKYTYDDSYYSKEWNYYKLWPLVSYETNSRGDFSFRTFALLFFRDPEGYTRMYSPFWSVVEYSSFNGNKKFGLLMRTYFQYWNEDVFYSKVPGIFTYKSRNREMQQFTFLFNLFGVVRRVDGSYFRFFYYPFKYSEKKGNTKIAAFDNNIDTFSEFEKELNLLDFNNQKKYNNVFFGYSVKW